MAGTGADEDEVTLCTTQARGGQICVGFAAPTARLQGSDRILGVSRRGQSDVLLTFSKSGLARYNVRPTCLVFRAVWLSLSQRLVACSCLIADVSEDGRRVQRVPNRAGAR
jgi:hypothetical protein